MTTRTAISRNQRKERHSSNAPSKEFPLCRPSALRLSRFLLIFVAMPAWTPSVARAQTVTTAHTGSSITDIRGRLKFLPSPPVLSGVPVTLEDERGGTLARTQTDSMGMFSFTVNSQAVYTVRVSYAGYREVAQRVPTAGAITDVLIILKSVNIPKGPREKPEYRLPVEGEDPEARVAQLQKAIETDPSNADGYLLLGRAYMDLGKWKEAQSALEEAIHKNDKSADAYLALGACLNQQKEFAAAEKALLRGLALDPESAPGHYELGRTYWALGHWPEVEPHARKALQLQPDLAAAHFLLGNVLLRKRDTRGALLEFNHYLKLDPRGPFAPAVHERVAEIEKALASPN